MLLDPLNTVFSPQNTGFTLFTSPAATARIVPRFKNFKEGSYEVPSVWGYHGF